MTRKLVAAVLGLAIFACIDEQKTGDVSQDSATTADTRQEVDTGGLTCGKCVQLWHTRSRPL